MNTQLKKQIMRRVYYSYGLSILSHPMFWHGVALSVAAYLLAQWLHVASIINNMLATPLGNTPEFVANSFVHAARGGELMVVFTVLAAGVIAALSVWRMTRVINFMLHPRMVSN